MSKNKKTFQDTPERPDWQILSSVLGREERPPENYDKEGAPRLKELLLEAYSTNPEGLVRITCCGDKGGPLTNFWKKTNFNQRVVEDSLRYTMSYLWTKREDGAASKARDEEKGTSGNAITYWEPKEGGIVAYIRERAGYAISQYVALNTIPKEVLSLDKLQEFNLEITNSGDFVRALNNYDDLHADESDLEVAENFYDLDKSEISEDLEPTALSDGDAISEAYDGALDPAEMSEAIERQKKEREIARQAAEFSNDIQFRSDNRPDLIWMEQVLGKKHDPEPDFDDRMEQMRELAVEVIDVHCQKMPSDEIEAIKEDISEWEPEKDNFLRAFPDVKSVTTEHLREIDKTAHIVEYMKNSKGVDGIQTTMVEVDSTQVTADDLIAQKNLWRQRSSPEMLDSKDRPDFVYLRHALGRDNAQGFEEYSNPDKLRAMGYRYIRQRVQENDLGVNLRHSMTEWDPTENYFHEEIADTISEMSLDGKLDPKEVETATRLFNPDSTVARQAWHELEVENSIDKELEKLEEPESVEQVGLSLGYDVD